MFLKEENILENIDDSRNGKYVVSVKIGGEILNNVKKLFSDKAELVKEIDKITEEYIKEKMGITDTFPIDNPVMNGKYIHNGKIYLLKGHSPIKKIEASTRDSYILFENGDIYHAGYNNTAQGGHGDKVVKEIHTKINFPQSELAEGEYIVDMSVSDASAYFLSNLGNVFNVGNNAYGNLGTGNTTNKDTISRLQFAFGSEVTKIITGGFATQQTVFFLTKGKKIFTCGCNAQGQCGTLDIVQYNIPKEITANFPSPVVDVSTGAINTTYGTTIFKLENGTCLLCGYNGYGQLGTKDVVASLNLVPLNIDLKPTDVITNIVAGGGVTIIVVNNRTLYACGYNDTGALGDGTLTTDAKVGFKEIITFHSDIKKILISSYANLETMTAVLLENGEVYTTGYNGVGQLGLLHTVNSLRFSRVITNGLIKDIALTYRGMLMLDYQNYIQTYGLNDQHQLGSGTTAVATNFYRYAFFYVDNVIKESYTVPDKDFIQIL